MRKKYDGASAFHVDLIEMVDDASYNDDDFFEEEDETPPPNPQSVNPGDEEGEFNDGDMHDGEFYDIGALI